jgi:hypothetical protein
MVAKVASTAKTLYFKVNFHRAVSTTWKIKNCSRTCMFWYYTCYYYDQILINVWCKLLQQVF